MLKKTINYTDFNGNAKQKTCYFHTAGPVIRHLKGKHVDECKVHQYVDVSKLHPKSETGQYCEVTAIDENVLGEVHTIKLN